MQKTLKRVTDAEFLDDPRRWPAWPFLPLISLKGDNKCAFVHADNSLEVFEGNIFDRATFGAYNSNSWKKLTTYSSAEALLAEWRID